MLAFLILGLGMVLIVGLVVASPVLFLAIFPVILVIGLAKEIIKCTKHPEAARIEREAKAKWDYAGVCGHIRR